MDKDRLLGGPELTRALLSMGEGVKAMLQDQDAKTARLVEAATYRAVGEALNQKQHVENWTGGSWYIAVFPHEIEALLAGKMPEGWERK